MLQAITEWDVLLRKDVHDFQQSITDKKLDKARKQKEFRAALRVQVDQNHRELMRQNQHRKRDAEKVLRQQKEQKEEDALKEQAKKEKNAMNCRAIQEQLKIRYLAMEEGKPQRQLLDSTARDALERKLDQEKTMNIETRRRIREDLQLNQAQNERLIREKAKHLAAERKRDTAEQLRYGQRVDKNNGENNDGVRLIAAQEAAEAEKRLQMRTFAEKTTSLEKDNEGIARAMMEKLKREEERIKRYQEENNAKAIAKERHEREKRAQAISDMKESIRQQLEERRRAELQQQEEAHEMACRSREIAAQEYLRQQREKKQTYDRQRAYKDELDDQRIYNQQHRKEQIDYEGMNEDELSINKRLLYRSGYKL